MKADNVKKLSDFFKAEAFRISKVYRISQDSAETILRNKFQKNKTLVEKAHASMELDDIKRLREYKDFLKNVKKDVYYLLRQYYTPEDKDNFINIITKLEQHITKRITPEIEADFERLTEFHTSTRERNPHLDKFNNFLFQNFNNCVSIFDIGGGVFPLTFPYIKFQLLHNYIWLDKDELAFRALKLREHYKYNQDLEFGLYNERIGQRDWTYYLPKGHTQFDLVLMLKLVPVIWRQERTLILKLAKIPAKHILLTGSKEAMTRKENIYRKENQSLKRFIEYTGRKVVKTFEFENEFGYVLT